MKMKNLIASLMIDAMSGLDIEINFNQLTKLYNRVATYMSHEFNKETLQKLTNADFI